MEASLMTTSYLTEPSAIEQKLFEIYQSIKHKNKTRASLFNLIVFTQAGHRDEYYRKIVQTIIENNPCRILFITSEKTDISYIKTAVSIVFSKRNNIACDNIDIAVSPHCYQAVSSIVLPHLITDLPIYLLWGEDVCKHNKLFSDLKDIANRVIIDSEVSENLSSLSTYLLSIRKKDKKDIADLNWVRTSNFRYLLTQLFQTAPDLLNTITSIELEYNNKTDQDFTNPSLKSLYLIAWLFSRLQWHLKKRDKKGFLFQKDEKEISFLVRSSSQENLPPGAIVKMQIHMENDLSFLIERDLFTGGFAKIGFSTKEQCDLPFYYHFEKAFSGLSLQKEMYNKKTSAHFLEALKMIKKIKKLPI